MNNNQNLSAGFLTTLASRILTASLYLFAVMTLVLSMMSCSKDSSVNPGPVPPTNETITTTVNTNEIKPGESINIQFTVTNITFNSGNVFTAQLSNASGNFLNPTIIGTLSGTESGNITGIIPADLAAGTGYRIRVNGSNPEIIGSDNGKNLSYPNLHTEATAILSGGPFVPTQSLHFDEDEMLFNLDSDYGYLIFLIKVNVNIPKLGNKDIGILLGVGFSGKAGNFEWNEDNLTGIIIQNPYNEDDYDVWVGYDGITKITTFSLTGITEGTFKGMFINPNTYQTFNAEGSFKVKYDNGQGIVSISSFKFIPSDKIRDSYRKSNIKK